MTPSRPAADHARHDPLVVAEAADRGGRLPPALAACPDCRALHADLVALAAAVPSAALPGRRRDYALTPADAARLRPAGWRRWLAAIGTSRDAVTRPLAVGLTTLGLAGLLAATIPGALPSAGGTAGAAPAASEVARQSEPSAAPSVPTALEAPAVGLGAASAAPAAPPSETTDVSAAPESEKAESDGVFMEGDAPDVAAGPNDGASADPGNAIGTVVDKRGAAPVVPMLAVIAGGMLLAGLVLFALRRRGRPA